MSEPELPLVALVGNPNAGKTTLFNALTGSSARTGNYPGITVEHREGVLEWEGQARARILDLPGSYSLVPRSDDERLVDLALAGKLAGEGRPSLVLAVCDASHLDRGLYLAVELLDRGAPVVVALTMTDTLEADGRTLDIATLGARLDAPVVAASGKSVEQVASLKERLVRVLEEAPSWALDLDDPPLEPQADDELGSAGDDVGGIDEVTARYVRIDELTAGIIEEGPEGPAGSASERRTDALDRVLLHPVAGPILGLLIFAALFQALFSWAQPLMELIESGMGLVAQTVVAVVPEDMVLVRSLLVDGVVAGVGNVLVFVPQIAFLFLFVAVLEDSGYLARAAFLLDRMMARVGLHGRAFVPLMSGFACAVPALMATRTIESEKDRLVTILVTPLVSCSARLPVYVLLIATLFSDVEPVFGFLPVGTLLLFMMYGLGVVAAIAVAAVLKRTLLKSPTPPLVLELPVYRRPVFKEVLRVAGDRVKVFIVDAGTIILAVTIVLWALFTFPRSDEIEAEKTQALAALVETEPAELLEQKQTIERHAAAKAIENSLAGRLGRSLEPVLEPAGWDWKIGVGLIASFAAREVLVSSLGLVYGLGEADEESVPLREALKRATFADGRKVFTPLSGLSLMVFFVLAMQCMSTLAAVRRETRSYRWPLFQLGYMSVLAWVAAVLVFQVGSWLGFGGG